MAATPLTDASFSVVGRGSIGDLAVRVVDVTLTAGYVGSGGYTLTAKQLGIGTSGVVYAVIPQGPASGFFYEYVLSTGKLRIRDASGTAAAATPEIADATSLSGITVRLVVLGKGHG